MSHDAALPNSPDSRQAVALRRRDPALHSAPVYNHILAGTFYTTCQDRLQDRTSGKTEGGLGGLGRCIAGQKAGARTAWLFRAGIPRRVRETPNWSRRWEGMRVQPGLRSLRIFCSQKSRPQGIERIVATLDGYSIREHHSTQRMEFVNQKKESKVPKVRKIRTCRY